MIYCDAFCLHKFTQDNAGNAGNAGNALVCKLNITEELLP